MEVTMQKAEEKYFVKRTAAQSFRYKSEHMLGSFEMQAVKRWVPSEQRLCTLQTVPALISIIDELISNAFDNHVKSSEAGFTQYHIQVTVDYTNNCITVRNTGKGITSKAHEEDNVPIAIKVFEAIDFSDAFPQDQGGRGNMLRSGQLGGGAKLANLWSHSFEVCTCDGDHHVKAVWQLSEQHMAELPQRRQEEKTSIVPCKERGYCKQGTTITMYPNLDAFGISSLEHAHVGEIVENRCYAMQAFVGTPLGSEGKRLTTPLSRFRRVTVTFNNKDLAKYVGSMKDLAKCFKPKDKNKPPVAAYRDVKALRYTSDEHTPVVCGIDIAVFKPDDVSEEVSSADENIFVVNSVNALSGGPFLDYIRARIVHQFADAFEMKSKLGSSSSINDQFRRKILSGNIVVFMSFAFPNVAFETNNKAKVVSSIQDYELVANQERSGTPDMVKDKFLKDLNNSYIHLKNALTQAHSSDQAVRNAHKVELPEDLQDADGVNGNVPTRNLRVLLVEGESAMPIAQSVQRKDRKSYGVYPVTGKMNNPDKKDESVKMHALKNVLGLAGVEQAPVATQVHKLRYAQIGIMADPDDDGTDIKCQLIRILFHQFPELVRNDHILFYEYVLPIGEACSQTGHVKDFLKEDDQLRFKRLRGTINWVYSYFKGLGSFNTDDAKNRMRIVWLEFDTESESLIEGVVGSVDTPLKQQKVKEYTHNIRDMKLRHTKISDLINTDFVRYLFRENTRKVHSVMDGLTESKRKVLYVMQQHIPDGEKIKTAQLGNKAADLTNYHHDENTLSKGIVPLAATYEGANNVPFLEGIGQFGTKQADGSNYATPRYSHVRAHQNLHLFFKKRFGLSLPLNEAEGQQVEVTHFVTPVMPYNHMDNTSKTHTCKVHARNLASLVQLYKKRIYGQINSFQSAYASEVAPCYKDSGWNGAIERKQNDNGWNSKGRCNFVRKDARKNSVYHVDTLPVGNNIGVQNTSGYKKELSQMRSHGKISGFKERHTERNICFEVFLTEEQENAAHREAHVNGRVQEPIMSYLHLIKTVQTDTVNMLDENGRVKHFGTGDKGVCSMQDYHFDIAWKYYEDVKKQLYENAMDEYNKAQNKLDYAEALMDEDTDFVDDVSEDAIAAFTNRGFEPIQDDKENGFAHLLNMPTRLLFSPGFDSLEADVQNKQEKVHRIQNKTAAGIWIDDMNYALNQRTDERDKHYDVDDNDEYAQQMPCTSTAHLDSEQMPYTLDHEDEGNERMSVDHNER